MTPKFSFKSISRSARETQGWGGKLARVLKPGNVVLMTANLGSGKTTFVQGLVKKLGAKDAALSPTFIMAQTYRAKFPIHHLDFYRLTKKEIFDMGIQDYLLGQGEIPPGLVLIEWAERCRDVWPPEHVHIQIKIKPTSTDREFLFSAHGTASVQALQRFQKKL